MARKKTLYVVVTENKNGSRYPYREEAYTAQGAVNKVRCYIDSNEKILCVYKQVENWK